MVDYSVVPLGGNEKIEIKGVRFGGGKNFVYWKNRDSVRISEAYVIFNKNYENITVKDGMVVLSLTGLNNYQDMMNAIVVFKRIFPDVKIKFVVGNTNERQVGQTISNKLGIGYEEMAVNNKLNKIEEQLKSDNKDLSASGSKNIYVENDTGIKKITVSDNKAYVNDRIDEDKLELFNKWKNDPVMSARMANMSSEEIDRMLMENVTSNLTSHRLESSLEQVANDRVGEVAMNKASREDGLVNAELGIVKNGVTNSNEYSAVEETNGNIQVVNSSVTASNISTSGVTSNTTGSEVSTIESDNTHLGYEEEQVRNIEEQVFYLSPQGEIYDEDSKLIGRLGQGYRMNYNDNTLLRDGQVIGVIGDYRDMGKNKENIYSKPKVRTLEKPIGSQNKSAAFISLPVVVFIISALLLIVSGVLLFVLD